MADPLSGKPGTTPNPVRPPLDPRSKRVLWLGIALTVLGGGSLAFSAFSWWGGSARDSVSMMLNAYASGVKTTASGLQYKVLTPGTGPHPANTDVALVNYEGKLLDGTIFDKSQQPTPMPIRGVVPGFSEGLKLMNKGAKYRFWLPAKLAYGERGAGPIPPNAPLVFDVELIEFLPQSVIEQYQRQQQQQMMGGGNPSVGSGPDSGGVPAAPGGQSAQ